MTPEDQWGDLDGHTYSGDTVTSINTAVHIFGGGANEVSVAFPAAGLQSLALLSTVPCVVTLTGVTVINHETTGDVTLAANVISHVHMVTGNVTAMSVGASTDAAGVAGTIKISVIFNS